MSTSRETATALPAAVVMMAGLGFRLGQLLEHQSLWGDEAMLALNVIARSYTRLAEPLDLAQSAPLLFLWVQRALYQLLGPTEMAFRLLPLIASCALLPVFYVMSRKLVSERVALVGLVILACASPLIGYAAESKPYAVDALVACLLLGAALWSIRSPVPRRWALLGGAGLLALLASTSSIFVLAGIGVVVAMKALRGRLPARSLLPMSAAGGAWVALFSFIHARMFRDAATSEYMQQFWAHAFLTPGPGFGARLSDGIAAVFNPIGALVYPPLMVPLLVIAFIGGGMLLVRNERAEIAALAVTPVLLAFVASALGRYPLSGRLMFFAVPGVTMLVAAGLVTAADRLGALTRVRPRWLLAGALLPLAVLATAGLFIRSRSYEELGPTVRVLRQIAAPSDPVYVFNRNAPTWLFYTVRSGSLGEETIAWVSRQVSPGGLAQMNGPSRGPRSPGEGTDLGYQDGDRRVLIGVASGSQFRAGVGFVPATTDTGWAQNEAARIEAAADPVIWMVMADYGRGEPQESAGVVAAAEQRGAALELAFSAGNTRLYRARFR